MKNFAIFSMGFCAGVFAYILYDYISNCIEERRETNNAERYSEMPLRAHKMDSEGIFTMVRPNNTSMEIEVENLEDLADVDSAPIHLDADKIPYPEGCRILTDKEFSMISTDENVESIEYVYFEEDGMISEEGDIFSTMSEAEIRSVLGDDNWETIVSGTLDEYHIFNDHKYILYTVTRYDGAWGDMAAYAATTMTPGV